MRPGDQYVNLLQEKLYFEFLRTPGQFREEVLAHQQKHPGALCVVDEIQRLPALLNEVHALIEGVRIGSFFRELFNKQNRLGHSSATIWSSFL